LQTIPTTALASEEGLPAPFPEPHLTLDEAATLPTKLQLRLAAWFRVSGQFDMAAAVIDLIDRYAGPSAALFDERAQLALARGESPAVHAAWEQRLADYPAPSARAAFARALLELGELEEASALSEELMTEHGDLATVQALAAEIAFQLGDLATAHDHWAAQLAQDPARVSPLLAMARVSLLGGDPEEARAALARAIADLESLTAAQLASAAGLAELLGQPARGQMLRMRYARKDAERAAALAAEVDAALDRPAQLIELAATPGPSPVNHPDATTIDGMSATELNSAPVEVVEESGEPVISDPEVIETLQRVFGHEEMLPGQASVIAKVMAGDDTLAILPTGAGKSLTFQLPSMLLPGTTLVLSPLIALMKDQIEGLPPALREQSVLVNSTLSADQQRRALDDIANGRLKLVYAAPERLRQQSFLRALRQTGVSLVVVDEAHCISLWGHDFRPDYLSIPAALPELGGPPLLAMTATATPETAASLSNAFRRDLQVVRTSSFRANLFYAAERLSTKEEKARRVVALCREFPGQGIVYVSSRSDAENLAGVLRDNGVSAVPYHAGLEQRLRAGNQDRFMSGGARVVVATVAFGMGVNKPDVRFIIHFSPSTSLEAYAQESGRAGRDGEDSRCVLLFTSADRANQTRLARRDAMDLPTLREVYAGIRRNASGPWAIFDPSRIVLTGGPNDNPDDLPDPRIGIGLLEQGKLLKRHPNAPVVYTLVPGSAEETEPGIPPSPEDTSLWQRLAEWAGLDESVNRPVTIQTAVVCTALDVSPETLARVLDQQPDWQVREGDRLPCLELLPAGENAGARMQRVLDDAAARAKDRVDRIMRYAEGRRCRHAELAAHLGERLIPCGVVCDVCTGEQAEAASARPKRERSPRKRATSTAADALLAMKALATAPFPVAKTGLTRLLEGSIQSRIQGDRSPYFGTLEDMQKSKIEAMIDGLVGDGLLVYDRSREFPVLRLTEEGALRLQGAEEA
jgi:ATP-dependent DNA helicase RecQ